MRQRLMQVLGSDESDEGMTDIVRRFWTRAKPLPLRAQPHIASRPGAEVVDLAAWSLARRPSR